MSETSKRVVSAICLGGLVLVLTYLGGWAFLIMVAIFASLVSWEWSGIVRKSGWDSISVLHALLALIAILIVQMQHSASFVVLGLMLIAGFLITAYLDRKNETLLWSLLGLIYVVFPAISLTFLRIHGDHGLVLLIFIFAIVWATDSAAYFVGRMLGGPKLWPAVSPKKTWTGFTGGLLGAFAVALLFAAILGVSGLALGAIALVLALASIAGDLFESALKRRFSVKDSSNLIPGHGGVLDRVDGLVFASVLAALIAVIVSPQHPAGALNLANAGLSMLL